jgi:hypothetical protein
MTALSKLKLVLVATTVLMVSDNISNGQTSSERSAGETSAIAKPAADPSAKADPDMAKVLAILNKLAPKPIETLTPVEARKQYTVADAVKKVIKDERLDFDPHKGHTWGAQFGVVPMPAKMDGLKLAQLSATGGNRSSSLRPPPT